MMTPRMTGEAALFFQEILLRDPDRVPAEHRPLAGAAARKFFRHVFDRHRGNHTLTWRAIMAVARTFETDPIESAELLRRCLDPEAVPRYGYKELTQLAEEVERLIPLDPAFVADVYRTVFGYEETSDEAVALSSGVLPMSSNRRQEYGMARWKLGQSFPEFLKHAPVHATRALIEIERGYATDREGGPDAAIPEAATFDLDGRTVRFIPDGSEGWFEGRVLDEEEKLLDQFSTRLKGLAEDASEEAAGKRREIIGAVVSETAPATVWKHILECASSAPSTLGMEIRSIAWAPNALLSAALRTATGDFIRAVHPALDDGERDKIERMLLDFPTFVGGEEFRVRRAEEIRDSILETLPADRLVVVEAKARFKEIERAGGTGTHSTPVRRRAGASEIPEDDLFRRIGVDIGLASNRKIRDLEQALLPFSEGHLNSAPTREKVDTAMPAARSLHEALQTASADGVQEGMFRHGWGTLAEACAVMVRTEGFGCDDETGRFVRSILLKASTNSAPERSSSDETLRGHLFIPVRQARIEAAEGLSLCMRDPSCVASDMREAVERLAGDPVPAVRHYIARNIGYVWKGDPDLAWRIVERICTSDPSTGVHDGLVRGTFNPMIASNLDHAAGLLFCLWSRIRGEDEAREPRCALASIFLRAYMWHDHPVAREFLFAVASNGPAYDHETRIVVANIYKALVTDRTTTDEDADAVRRRAWALLERISAPVGDAFRAARKKIEGGAVLSDEERANLTDLGRIADEIASRLYFGSGAYEAKREGGGREGPELDEDQMARFLREGERVLADVAAVGAPPVAHHLMETLAHLSSASPREVFLWIGRVLETARMWGYQEDPQALKLFVEIVERYFAQYRWVFDDADCRRELRKVLDIFVETGRPEVLRLTHKIDDLFR